MPRSSLALPMLMLVASLTGAVASGAEAAHKERARDLGVPFDGTPGPLNAITDVEGVLVGHTTLISGDGKLVVGKGPIRTGVTAVLPRGPASLQRFSFAGWYSQNGNGEMTGTTWVEESGFLEGPILITNTHSVGVVRDAVIAWRVASLLPPKGKRAPWTLTLPAIRDWSDDDQLKLEWNQFTGRLEEMFLGGCFPSVSEFMRLRSMAEDSFSYPLGDAVYFKYLYQEEGFIDLSPNLCVQVMRTRRPDRSRLDPGSTQVARYLVQRAKHRRTLLLRRLKIEPSSSDGFRAPESDMGDLSLIFHDDQFLRLFFEGIDASRDTKRPALLLGARTMAGLRAATAAVLTSASCAELDKTKVDCLAFLGLRAAMPMLHIWVNGNPDDLPLGATVSSVLNALTRNEREGAVPRLRIERLFRDTYVDVSFPPTWQVLSQLPLYAGDRLSW